MNKLNSLFKEKEKNILNIYFTAGHPTIDSLPQIISALDDAGVDIIEIGMPYSDPMADGETIQRSSEKALLNGMKLDLLFDQIQEVRKDHNIPIILMGYLNQILQYGDQKFFQKCHENKIDGLIIPDLPLDIYTDSYQEKFIKNKLSICFLVTPQTSQERIKLASKLSTGFLYVVSSSSITGAKKDIKSDQLEYFDTIEQLKGSTPSLIGFGIHDKASFSKACQHANGAIIGSQFIRILEEKGHNSETIKDFIYSLR